MVAVFAVNPEIRDRVKHRHDILDGRLLQKIIVAGARDVAAAGGHDPQDVARPMAHGLRRARDEDMVRIDGAVEENRVAVPCFERGQVHAAAAGRTDTKNVLEKEGDALRARAVYGRGRNLDGWL